MTEQIPEPTDLAAFVADRLPSLRDAESGFAEGWDRPATSLTEEGSPLTEFMTHASSPVPAARGERTRWHEEYDRLAEVARAAVDDAVEHHGLQQERARWAQARAAADSVDMAQAQAGGDFLHDMFGVKSAQPSQKKPEADAPAPRKFGRW